MSRSEMTEAPSNLQHERNTEYDLFTKGRIIGMWESGISIQNVAKQLNMPYTSVYGIVQKWKTEGSVESAPRPGCPKKLKAIDLRAIERCVRREPSATYDQILQQLKLAGTEISRSTLKSALKDMGYRSCMSSSSSGDTHKKRRLILGPDNDRPCLEPKRKRK